MVWDASNGEEVLTLSGHRERVYSMGFSPDGKRIVSGDENGNLKVWDASSGEELLTLSGHTDKVTSVAFSPDGQRIYAESYYGKRIVWNSKTGEQIRDAEWCSPSDIENKTQPTNGRWKVFPSGSHVLLVDYKFKDTLREKEYRLAKARFDPVWHFEEAYKADGKDLYAATFHFAWLVKNNPEDTYLQNRFRDSYSKLDQNKRNLEDILPPVVKEALKLIAETKPANETNDDDDK